MRRNLWIRNDKKTIEAEYDIATLASQEIRLEDTLLILEDMHYKEKVLSIKEFEESYKLVNGMIDLIKKVKAKKVRPEELKEQSLKLILLLSLLRKKHEKKQIHETENESE